RWKGPGFPEPPMPEPSAFDLLILRVRAGDHDAAAEVVRQYEPAIRRAVRFRITDAHLRAQLDSIDICQTVLKSFFVAAASVQYPLEPPAQLLALLATMARRKLIPEGRRHRSQRRGAQHHAASSEDMQVLVSPGNNPPEEVEARDLLQE